MFNRMVIYNKFKEVAEKYLDKEIFLGQETKSYLGDKPETYFYFLERVNFTAEVLNFEIPEDYYVFRSDNKMDYYVNFFACNKIGKTFVPLPNDIGKDHYNEVVLKVSESDLSDVALILSTSGTTGKSKGVKFSEKSIVENLATAVEAFDITNETITWAYGSPSLAGMLIGLTISTVLAGGQVILDNFRMLRLNKFISEYKPTLMFIPPTTINMIKKYKRISNNLDLTSFKKIIVSATKPTESDIKYLLEKGAQIIHHGYSASDIACSTAVLGRDISSTENIDLTFEKVYGNWKIDWVEDELIVSGPGLSSGYLESELNEGTYKGGWFYSGDIVSRDLEHLSRKRDIIKSRGFYISPLTIESCIKELDNVEDCSTVSVPHKLYGEEIISFVIDKVEGIYDKRDIINHCKTKLQKTHIPHDVIFIDKFPVTKFGHALKISKEQLRRSLGWYNIKNKWAWFGEFDYQKFESVEVDLKDIEFVAITTDDELLKYKKEIERGLKVFDETTDPPYEEMWDFTEAMVRIKSGGIFMMLIHGDTAICWNWCFTGEWTIPDHGWNLNIYVPDKCTYSANWWFHPKYRSSKKYPIIIKDFAFLNFSWYKENGYKKDYTYVDEWNWTSQSVCRKLGYVGSGWLDLG